MLRMQLLLAVRLAVLVILSTSWLESCAEKPAYRFEPIAQEVLVGKSSRIEVRVLDATGKSVPSKSISVQSVRLDMGPDGMAAMDAPLSQIDGSTRDALAFEGDISMAGRWALTITVAVEGSKTPLTETIVFTAVKQKAEAGSTVAPAGERRILYYRNPMGLADVSPTPKKDPMGMAYIPVYSDEITGVSGTVTISPEKIQRAGVRTQAVERHALTVTVRAVGTVVHDESRLAVVTAKFDGFVDEMMVSTVGAEVDAGQPLLRVWVESKEILQKEADFLTALRSGDDDYKREARNNLRLFGVPDETIRGLERTRQPVRAIVFAAPFRGRVIEKPALKGMRFSAGDVLFRVADHSVVWVMAQVAERDLGALEVGQPAKVTLTAGASEPIEGKVALIYPELDLATRTAMVRISVPNPDERIKVGQYADVRIEAPLSTEPRIAVPVSAVLDSGTRRVVFVAKANGVFEPRDVTLGRRGDDLVEIKGGVAEGEQIVVSGNFLIDAESNLRSALAAFGPPKATP